MHKQSQHRLAYTAALTALTALLAGCGGGGEHRPDDNTRNEELAPVATSCPEAVPETAQCLSGQDSKGAFYMIAIPKDWQGDLVVHAHGGPALGAPTMERVEEDLTRWAVMVQAGYAWAGSSFRQGGVEVRAAAEDSERVRRIFNAYVAKPKTTFLHGQSWGASVAAKGAEMDALQSPKHPNYDGVLLTNGVLAGGSRSYDFRLDLRALYQYLCENHPRATEASYPLNIGFPAGRSITNANIAARTQECLGLGSAPEARTAEQQAKIDTIVRVIRIPEDAIQSHLNWGTRHFQDIVSERTGGASPFGNIGVQYVGSDDDVALNAGIERFEADPAAYAMLVEDTDLTGRIAVPVLSVKWKSDPTAFVELDAFFKQTMDNAGAGGRLVQTFTNEGTHSYINDVAYVSLMQALSAWVKQGHQPTPTAVAARCEALAASWQQECTFDPAFVPQPLETRVPPRQRPGQS